MSSGALNEYLTALFTGDPAKAVALLERVAGRGGEPVPSMLRLALHRQPASMLLWRKLHNVWTRLERPMLKPNPVKKRVLLLTDFTADGLAPDIALMAAAYGVAADIAMPPFDTVEQTAIAGDLSGHDVVVVVLSEEWLRRHLGAGGIVERDRVTATLNHLNDLLTSIHERSGATILLATFAAPTYATPGGSARGGTVVGWNVALALLNAALGNLAIPDVHLVDVADALFGAGGRTTLGRASFLRARIAYEPAGAIAVARTIAAAIANLSGKTHRALITDWDNTLWGGEIAELGAASVVCGQDSPDALAYSRVQERLRALKSMGVLLGAVSRNDPAVAETLSANRELLLGPGDFACLHVSWDPKSAGIAQAAQALGFGSEFMVFLDDSLFEISEVVRAHPDIDVVLAGPQPQQTLDRLSESHFFDAVHVVADDLERGERAAVLRQQRERRSTFVSLEDFLRDIRIQLRVQPLNAANAERVVQLLQKTNQFNLTTRRHSRADLAALEAKGATVLAFEYEDAFGPQGIISVVILVPETGGLRIDTWLMSCRVLNRTVEAAVFDHIVARAAGQKVIGEYIPTAKNGLVRNLFSSLGFRRDAGGGGGAERWIYEGAKHPPHFATVTDD